MKLVIAQMKHETNTFSPVPTPRSAPSSPVDDEAYEAMAGRIVAAVAKGCDAVLLDLHGAMVTRTYDDGEGELLARIRRIAPQVPIGVALDMHTNLFPAMAQLATVIAGYQTYPHADIPYAGSSAVVVTDGDAAKARALCDELLDRAWRGRLHVRLFTVELPPRAPADVSARSRNPAARLMMAT